jgi:hypothetical protein
MSIRAIEKAKSANAKRKAAKRKAAHKRKTEKRNSMLDAMHDARSAQCSGLAAGAGRG